MANLKINRGTSFFIGVNYEKDKVPHTLVGATVRFTIKTRESDADLADGSALVVKNVSSGDASGYAEIEITPADTQAIPPGKLYYDVKVDEQSNGTRVYKIDEGTIKLDGSPTNRL